MKEPQSISRRFFVSGGATILLPVMTGAAVRGDEAMYVGGTITSIPEKTEGRLLLDDSAALKFTSKKGDLSITYTKVSSIEYGQKAGRRVGVALAVSPLALFSKKRKHYVTIGFADEAGKNQGAVLEVSKSNVRSLLTTLETRSGKQVEFESEEAKKNVGR